MARKVAMRSTRPPLALSLCMMIVLTSCANSKPENRLETLDVNIAAYYDHLRWGHFEEAASMRNPDNAYYKTIHNDEFKNIHISGYEVTAKQIGVNGDEASIAVDLEYYDDDNGTVHHLRDQQRWIYSKPVKRWLNDGDLPKFQQPSGH